MCVLCHLNCKLCSTQQGPVSTKDKGIFSGEQTTDAELRYYLGRHISFRHVRTRTGTRSEYPHPRPWLDVPLARIPRKTFHTCSHDGMKPIESIVGDCVEEVGHVWKSGTGCFGFRTRPDGVGSGRGHHVQAGKLLGVLSNTRRSVIDELHVTGKEQRHENHEVRT